jgi:hypothetical protein
MSRILAASVPITFVAASDASKKARDLATYRCNGTADDVEIQAAIDALPSGGGTVVLSEGTFTTSSTINLSSYDALQGQGRRVTIIKRAAGFTDTLLDGVGTDRTTDTILDVDISSLRLDGSTLAGKLIDAKYAHRWTLRDVTFWDAADHAIYAEECWLWHLDHVEFEYCGKVSNTKSVVLFYNGEDDNTNDWTHIGCRWENNYWTEIESDAGGGSALDFNARMRYTDCKWERASDGGADAPIITGPFQATSWINPHFIYGKQAAIVLSADGSENEILGGYFQTLCSSSGNGDIDIQCDRNRIIGPTFVSTGASQHIYVNGEENVVDDITYWDGSAIPPVTVPASTKHRNSIGRMTGNQRFIYPGNIVTMIRALYFADIVDGGGASGYMDFSAAEPIPAGSIVQSVKLDFTTAFNSDNTSTLTVMIGYVGDLDAFSKTGDPGDEAFNHTTDAYWGESACQEPIVTTAATIRVTFTEDNDITNIISGAGAQGALTITITYMKA